MGRDDRRADPVARARLSAHPRSRRGAIVIMSRAVVSRVPASAPPRRRRPPKPSPSRAPPPRISVGIVPGRRAILGGFLSGLLARTSPPASASASCARDPPDIAAALALARELYGDGRLDEADLLLTTAASCSRTDPIAPRSTRASSAPLLKLLGDVRVDALRYARAVEAYDAALEADPAGPSAPGAHFGRANAFEGLASEAEGDANGESRRLYALAVDDYSRCLELAPEADEVSTTYFERAQAERALGRWKDAREDYGRGGDEVSGETGEKIRRRVGRAGSLRHLRGGRFDPREGAVGDARSSPVLQRRSRGAGGVLLAHGGGGSGGGRVVETVRDEKLEGAASTETGTG